MLSFLPYSVDRLFMTWLCSYCQHWFTSVELNWVSSPLLLGFCQWMSILCHDRGWKYPCALLLICHTPRALQRSIELVGATISADSQATAGYRNDVNREPPNCPPEPSLSVQLTASGMKWLYFTLRHWEERCVLCDIMVVLGTRSFLTFALVLLTTHWNHRTRTE